MLLAFHYPNRINQLIQSEGEYGSTNSRQPPKRREGAKSVRQNVWKMSARSNFRLKDHAPLPFEEAAFLLSTISGFAVRCDMTRSSISVKERLLEAIETLREDQQIDLLAYIERRKKLPKGEPGWKLIEDARQLGFTTQDLAEMQQAIEEADVVIPDRSQDVMNLDTPES
jgi:hypothetical protein